MKWIVEFRTVTHTFMAVEAETEDEAIDMITDPDTFVHEWLDVEYDRVGTYSSERLDDRLKQLQKAGVR